MKTHTIAQILFGLFLLISACTSPSGSTKYNVSMEELQRDSMRIDSFNYFLTLSNNFLVSNKNDSALQSLLTARKFVKHQNETDQIKSLIDSIQFVQANYFIKKHKYKSALPLLDTLIQSDPSNSDYLYKSGLCKSKTGQTASAAKDLQKAIKLGNEKADLLHEKINPIRKRITGYVTRCCDGSTSNATGRGACSHHGGVCNWNDPIYDEYRKY